MEEETEFDEIFRLHYSQLFIFAMQYINNKEECYDIVSSAYEYVWTNFRKMERSTIKNYLYTLVKSKCIDYLRHCNTHENHIQAYLKLCQEENESNIETEERINRIYTLMKTMPEQTRKILEACYLDQKRYQEVAEELNISTNTVKKHIMKALQLLRQEFAKK